MSPASASSPSPEATDLRPTVVRYKVVGFAASLAIITYIDRVCIAQAAPLIRKDLGLDTVQMAWAFSAFAWAYAVFEIPGGWMGDRFGARKALTRVVVWWSIFTAATGWVKNSVSLIATRTLFGAGEAGCFPNLTRAFSAWLPPQERVRAQGLLWLSARWAGAFTPLLVVLMLDYFTWRQVFEIFGAIGIAWAVVFWFWYRDKPGAHKGVNAAELALLRDAQPELAQGPIPWRRFLQSRTVWLLWAQYFCLNYGWAFYITWLPTYLTEARGVGLKQGGLLAGIPLFFGGIGSLATGYVSMPLARWTGAMARSRRILAMSGFVGAATGIWLSPAITDPTLAMVALGISSFANDLVMPTSWATCMDVGGRYAGTLSGSMNMIGAVSAGLAPIMVGYLLKWSGQDWPLTFYVSAAAYLLGTISWIFIDSTTPLDQ